MVVVWPRMKELLKRFSEFQLEIEPTTSVTLTFDKSFRVYLLVNYLSISLFVFICDFHFTAIHGHTTAA